MLGKVRILRVSDGAIAEGVDLGPGCSDPEGLAWIWEEGNFHCDCNRALFFARFRGEDDPFDIGEQGHCGHGAYLVRLEIDGELAFDEITERLRPSEAKPCS